MASKVFRYRTLIPVSIFLAWVASFAPVPAQETSTSHSRPISLKRVLITKERVAQELEKVREGAFVILPLRELEEKLNQAKTPADKAIDEPPGIRHATYSATLEGDTLREGRGEWRVHAGKGPTVLPLGQLNLALANVKWQQGGDAILGEFDGKSAGLLVEGPEQTNVFFDWSAQGKSKGQEISFEFKLPECPRTSIELKIPQGMTPIFSRPWGVVEGPTPTERGDLQRWKITTSGKGPFELSLRKNPLPGGIVAFFKTLGKLQWNPNRVLVEFDFSLETPLGAFQDLALEVEEGWEPVDIQSRFAEIEKSVWTPASPAASTPGAKNVEKTRPGLLELHFRRPIGGTVPNLKLICQRVEVPTEGVTVPRVRVRDMASRGEQIRLVIHPELQLKKWDLGDFRLDKTNPNSDGGLEHFLVNTGENPAKAEKRPILWVERSKAEVYVEQKSTWRLEPDGESLYAELDYHVLRGRVYRLAVKLPTPSSRWEVHQVSMAMAGQLRSWYVNAGFLIVELHPALDARMEAKLKIEMRGAQRTKSTQSLLDFPQVVPQDTSARDGSLEIQADPSVTVQLVESNLSPVDQNASGLARMDRPEFAFAFRNQTPTGKINVARRLPRPDVSVRSHIKLGDRHGVARFTFEIEGRSQGIEHLDFHWMHPSASSPRVVSPEADPPRITWLPFGEAPPWMLLLGPPHPFAQATLVTDLSHRHWYRIRFPVPLRGKKTVTVEGPIAADENAAETAFCLPWVRPLNSRVGELTATVEAESGELVFEDPNLVANASPRPFIADVRTMNPRIRVRPKPTFADEAWNPDQAFWTVRVLGEGRCLHQYEIAWNNTTSTEVSFRLPRSANCEGVRAKGHWLQVVETDADDDTREIHVRVPLGKQRLQILYTTKWQPHLFGGECPLPGPRFARAPSIVHRRFFLPEKLHTWSDQRFRREGMDSITALEWSISTLWRLGKPALRELGWTSEPEGSIPAKILLNRSEEEIRGELQKLGSLGEAFGRLRKHHRKDTAPWVIDQTAFSDLRLEPASPLPAHAKMKSSNAFWEAVGIRPWYHEGAIVWTSARRLALFQSGGEPSSAIANAAEHGRDGTGVFVSLPAWLFREVQAEETFASPDPLLTGSDFGTEAAVSWLDLEPDAANVFLFDGSVLAWGIWFWVALLAGLFALVNRRRSLVGSFRVLVILLTLLVLGLLWAPITLGQWLGVPFLAGGGFLSLIWIVRLYAKDSKVRSPTSTSHRSTASFASMFMLVVLASWSAAQTVADVHTIFVWFDPALQDWQAMTEPDVLKAISTPKDETPNAFKNVVITRARYQGKVLEGVSEWEAEFEIYQREPKGVLTLPLQGVQLQEGVFLDGVPVFPVADAAGFKLPIKSRGTHRLTLSFQAPTRPQAGTNAVEVRFSIPRVSQSMASVTFAGKTFGTQFQVCQGAEQWTAGTGEKPGELRGQLGSEATLAVRWTNGSVASAKTPANQVQETHWWDLRSPFPVLFSMFQYTIAKTGTSQFTIGIPDELELRKVTPLATGSGEMLEMRVANVLGKRMLQIEWDRPISGTFSLAVEWVPRVPVRAGAVYLPLPNPLQAIPSEGTLGYSLTNGFETIERAKNLAVVGLSPSGFQDRVKHLSWDAQTANRGFTFRRFSGNAGLELELRPQRPEASKGLVEWHLGLKSRFRAQWTMRTQDRGASYLEFTVPPQLQILDVDSLVAPGSATTGSNFLHHWNVSDGKLAVWLKPPPKNTDFQVVVSGWYLNAEKGRQLLPTITPVGIRVRMHEVILAELPGGKIHVEASKKELLESVPGRYALLSSEGPPQIAFQWKKTPPIPDASVNVHVEERQGEIHYEATVVLHAGAVTNEPTLRVRVPGEWTGTNWKLDGPGNLKFQRAKQELEWTAKIPSKSPSRLEFLVRGREKLDHGMVWEAPQLEIAGVRISKRSVKWTNLRVPADRIAGWEVNDPKLLEANTGQVNLHEKNRMAFQRLPASEKSRGFRIDLSSYHVFRGAAMDWLHVCNFHVAHEGEPLEFRLPDGAKLRHLRVNGLPVPKVTQEKNLSIPFTRNAGTANVEVQWSYAMGREPLDQPVLALPRIAGHVPLGRSGCVWVPLGWSVRQTQGLQILPDAEFLAEKADAYLASRAGRDRAQANKVERAAWLERSLESQLVASAFSPTNPASLKRLRSLLDLSRKKEVEPTPRNSASSLGEANDFMEPVGVPLYWTAEPGAEVLLQLRNDTSIAQNARQSFTELWAAGAIGFIALSFLKRGISWLRVFLPETLATGAVWAMVAWGWSGVGLAILAFAIFVRVNFVWRSLRRSKTPARPGGNSTHSQSSQPPSAF